MIRIAFEKYQATGNDFILIDNRSGKYTLTLEQIKRLCHRKFGIGADGLMLIEPHPTADFNLVYHNSDGSQSLCGNGSRAAVAMAATLGIVNRQTTFQAFDGVHQAELLLNGDIRLHMNDVNQVTHLGEDIVLNTGSPHFIRFVNRVYDYPVYAEGKRLRESESFKPGGTNVNFVELQENNAIFVRTYERGVENETLSCGTGVTAAALAASQKGYTSPVVVHTLGGDLAVEFQAGDTFTGISLIGPAKKVFEGVLEL